MTLLIHFYWPLMVASLLIGLVSGILAFRRRGLKSPRVP